MKWLLAFLAVAGLVGLVSLLSAPSPPSGPPKDWTPADARGELVRRYGQPDDREEESGDYLMRYGDVRARYGRHAESLQWVFLGFEDAAGGRLTAERAEELLRGRRR